MRNHVRNLGIQFALFRGQHERKQRGHDVA